MIDALGGFAERALAWSHEDGGGDLAAALARGQVFPIVAGIVRGREALEAAPEVAVRQFALALLGAATLAFPERPRSRVEALVEHQRRRLASRSPAEREVWAAASESFLYSAALRRAARLFAELARGEPEVERLRDAAGDLGTLLAMLLVRRGCLIRSVVERDRR